MSINTAPVSPAAVRVSYCAVRILYDLILTHTSRPTAGFWSLPLLCCECDHVIGNNLVLRARYSETAS